MYLLSYLYLRRLLTALTAPTANDNSVCRIVSDEDLKNSDFVRDARNFITVFTLIRNIKPGNVHDVFTAMYRDYSGTIVDHNGDEVFLDTDALEWDEETLLFADNEVLNQEKQRFYKWYESFASFCPEGMNPRIRHESKERARVIITIAKACFADQSRLWGIEGKAANDNIAPDA